MFSLSNCKNMIVPHMISHDGCLATMEQSSNMITREAKEYHEIYTPTSNPFARKTRSGHLYPTEWPRARLTSILTRVSLMCNRDTFYYILLYQCMFPPHPFLDLSRQLGILPISLCGFLLTMTEMECGYLTACWRNL